MIPKWRLSYRVLLIVSVNRLSKFRIVFVRVSSIKRLNLFSFISSRCHLNPKCSFVGIGWFECNRTIRFFYFSFWVILIFVSTFLLLLLFSRRRELLFLVSACGLAVDLVMADSVDVILDFLRRNRFKSAEAALRGELSNRSDLIRSIQKSIHEEKDLGNPLDEEEEDKPDVENLGKGRRTSGEVSKELIVKEIECGTSKSGSDNKLRTAASIVERYKTNESAGTSEKRFSLAQGFEDTSPDFSSWKVNSSNAPLGPFEKDSSVITNNFSQLQISEQSKHRSKASDKGDSVIEAVKSGESYAIELGLPGEQRTSRFGSTSISNAELKYEKNQTSDLREVDQHYGPTPVYSKHSLADNPWSKSEESTQPSSDPWKDCSVKTVLPFSIGNASTSYESGLASSDNKKEGTRKVETKVIRTAMKEQVEEVERSLFFGKSKGSSEQKSVCNLDLPIVTENHKEELPRLAPVKLKLEDKLVNINWEEKFDHHGDGPKFTSADNTFLIGSFLDVPVGQEINSSGLFVNVFWS